MAFWVVLDVISLNRSQEKAQTSLALSNDQLIKIQRYKHYTERFKTNYTV